MPDNIPTSSPPTGGIARDSLKLISSGAIGQLVAFLLIPIIGRWYNEEVMGSLGIFMAWGGLLSIIASGRYEQAIVIAPNNTSGRISALLSLGLCTLFACLLIPVVRVVRMYGGGDDLGSLIYLLPAYVLLLATYNVGSLWSLRMQHYNRLSVGQLVQGTSNNLLKVCLGCVSRTACSLIASAMISILLALLPHAKGLASLLKKPMPMRKEICRIAQTYRNFPRYGMVQALVDTLLGSLLVLMLPLQFRAREVGFLTMATMLALRPVGILSTSFSQVYLQRLSKSVSRGEHIAPTIRTFAVRFVFIATGLAILLAWIMPFLVRIVVGEGWETSALIIRWMLPMLIPNFLSSVFNVLPDIFGLQRANLTIELLFLVFDFAVILVGLNCLSFTSFIPFYFLLKMVREIFYLLFLIRIIARYERKLHALA